MEKSISFNSFSQQATILAFLSSFSLIACAKYPKEVQTNLTKLKNTKSCPGCYLPGIELISFDLKNANLTGANLRRSDLTGADLTDANLTDADLMGVDLTGTKLVNSKISVSLTI